MKPISTNKAAEALKELTETIAIPYLYNILKEAAKRRYCEIACIIDRNDAIKLESEGFSVTTTTNGTTIIKW